MKIFSNKFRMMLSVLISFTALVSCNREELEIQQDFPFEIKVMPVPAEIAKGVTVEIRITIDPEGSYSCAQYFIRYFQFEGKGALSYYDEPPYLPNDLYPLPDKQVWLYYTSQSTVSQSFDVWISDNFGNEKQLSFEFNSSN